MKRLYSSILALLSASAAFTFIVGAAVPDGYYDTLSGLNGSSLRKAAKSVVRQHSVVSYGTDTWNAFRSTDTRFVNGQNCWWDMYSDNNVPVSSGHSGMNIEHSVANSWWGGTKNDAYKDLFHLNPSDATANNRKSNYPLGEVGSITWTNGVTTVGRPVNGQGGGNGYVYEPCDEYKGDFARVFMYMFTVYDDIAWDAAKGWMFDKASDDIFKPWAIDLLLKWHRQDPVSPKEIARNEAIYSIQHNRNPYIDSPELAEYVWGSHKTQKYSYNGDYDPTQPPVDPKPDDPKPDDPVVPSEGEWELVETISDINTSDSYVLVGLGSNSTVAMSTSAAANNSVAYLKPTADVSISDNFITSLPDDAAVIRFVRNGAYWEATIENLSGKSLGRLSSPSVKHLVITDSPVADECKFSLNISGGNAEFSFDSTVGKIFYNESSPRFTTYTSTGQKPTALYRKCDKLSGIDEIESSQSLPVRIFNLHGVEMDPSSKLAPGIYIRVTPGCRAEKFISK